ncbi:conjugal transfer protein TraG N-terminal domain-containing protein [Halomonas sp. AOP42-D1-22]|uniref:conjugal transfer protein TraG N-terminal domain-containing protein n=1 Tax=Halomonas sp. AOP42-D1-22 TaxID=3457667 RepID=UPI0040340733
MDATIYSIGSSAYLKEIIMAVTSIIGTGGFSKLIQSGLLLGVLIMAFQTLFNGGKPVAVHQIAVSGLLFALMFGPTVDVAIEGVYDGQSHAVADVPIGIALPGSLVSQVGYGLTEMFETAFSSPSGATSGYGLTDGAGYADALKMLMEIRRNGNNADLLSTIDSVGTGGTNNFRGSWDNYIRECTAMKIDLNDISIEQIYNEGDHMDGLKFESELFGTVITHNGATQTLSCTAAFAALEAWTTSVVASEEVKSAIGRQIGLHSTGGHGSLAEPDTDAFVAANGALGALSQSATGAQQYIQTAILEPIFHQAMSGRYRDIHDFSASTMINQALQQRNVQWAAEQTIFMSIVRPMITFIEGFAYAITPFMAFIIVLGAFGMKLAIKYGQMLLWIQLWLPVLAITNFFLYMVASSELAQLDNATTSFYELHQAGERLGYWVSVGGMLAAATPILTLVLLTGSTYAMTSLAQKMGGSDHVDEKQMAPDVLRQGAVMDQVSMQTSSQMTGRANTDSEKVMEKLSLQDALNTSYQSSSQQMDQASQSFLGSFAKTFSAGDSRNISNARGEAIQKGLNSMSSEGQSNIQNAAAAWREEHGLSDDYKQSSEQAFTAAASVGVGFSAPFSIFTAGVKSTSSESERAAASLTVSSSDVQQFGGGFQVSSSDTAQLARTLASTATSGNTDTNSQLWQSSEASAMQEQAAEVLSASESYQEAAAANQQLTNGLSTHANHLGELVAGNREATAELNSFFQSNPELNSMANEQADRWSSTYGLDHQTATAAARLSVMSKASSYGGDSGAYTEGANALSSVISTATGTQSSSTFNDPGANVNTAPRESLASSGQVGGGAYAPTPNHSGPVGNGAMGDALVREDYEASQGDMDGKAADGWSEQTRAAQERLIDRVDASGDTSFSPLVFGKPDSAAADQLSQQHNGFNATHIERAARIMNGSSDIDPGYLTTQLSHLGMEPGAAGALSLGASGGSLPQNASSSQQAAYMAGQELRNGNTTGAVDSTRAAAAGQYAESIGLSPGSQLIYQSRVMTDEGHARELFEQGYEQVRQEVANGGGVSVDAMSEDQQRLTAAIVKDAFDNTETAAGPATMQFGRQHGAINNRAD